MRTIADINAMYDHLESQANRMRARVRELHEMGLYKTRGAMSRRIEFEDLTRDLREIEAELYALGWVLGEVPVWESKSPFELGDFHERE